METKPKYVKFEQNAVIILDDIDSRSIPVKDLKFCGFCTLPDKRSVYHYSPSAPAKPSHSSATEDGLELSASVSSGQETGGGLNSKV